jgi:polyhydroxyalkanoate synthesis repressor PhaR
MPIIKRYPNRKLYDTEARRYITLEGIAALIREGQSVTVVDHASGEDLTALTLSQVISEQEKKGNSFLPQSVLAGLIQAGGETISGLRHALASPLNLARHVDEEIEKRVYTLVSCGKLAAEEGQRWRNELLALSPGGSGPDWPSDDDVHLALARRGIPRGEDLQRILEQLEVLETKLDSLAQPPR